MSHYITTTFRHGASRVLCAWNDGHEGPCEPTDTRKPNERHRAVGDLSICVNPEPHEMAWGICVPEPTLTGTPGPIMEAAKTKHWTDVEPHWPEEAMPTAKQYLDWLIWHIEHGSTEKPLESLERLINNAYDGIQCSMRHPREALGTLRTITNPMLAMDVEHPDHQPQPHWLDEYEGLVE